MSWWIDEAPYPGPDDSDIPLYMPADGSRLSIGSMYFSGGGMPLGIVSGIDLDNRTVELITKSLKNTDSFSVETTWRLT